MNLTQLQHEISIWRFSKKRAINMIVGITALLVYEFIAKPYYRPYIYANHISDFHIADTLGNSLGVVAAVFILVALLGRQVEPNYFIINAVVIGNVLYELGHPMLGKPIDPWDVIATILSGGFCLFLYKFMHYKEVPDGSTKKS